MALNIWLEWIDQKSSEQPTPQKKKLPIKTNLLGRISVTVGLLQDALHVALGNAENQPIQWSLVGGCVIVDLTEVSSSIFPLLQLWC